MGAEGRKDTSPCSTYHKGSTRPRPWYIPLSQPRPLPLFRCHRSNRTTLGMNYIDSSSDDNHDRCQTLVQVHGLASLRRNTRDFSNRSDAASGPPSSLRALSQSPLFSPLGDENQEYTWFSRVLGFFFVGIQGFLEFIGVTALSFC